MFAKGKIMSLDVCKQCAKHISANADQCPHCGFIVSAFARKILANALKEKPCRICGHMLAYNAHRRLETSSSTSWIKGTSYTNSYTSVQHEACPQCGEPRPLLEPGDMWVNKLLYVLLLIPLFFMTNFIGDHIGIGYGQIFIVVIGAAWLWFGLSRGSSLLSWYERLF